MTPHYVYKIQNINGGKMYIGRTVDVIRRWKEHAWGNKDSYITSAIHKHGVDAFTFDVIAETSADQIEEVEQWYIMLYDCVVPRGYNLIERGEGNCGHHPETCQKISRAHTGKVLRPETKAKMSISRMGALNPNYGKPGATCRSVTQYTLEGHRLAEHPSLRTAAGGDNNMATQIGRVCKHGCGTAQKYMWRYSDGAPNVLPPHIPTPHPTRSVQQMRDGEVIATFPSISAAAAAVGAAAPNISGALGSKTRKCSGCSWQYEDKCPPAQYRKIVYGQCSIP